MELLRFGRIIDSDPLIPADTPHWREVSHADGKGWINLNASGIQKFSDADFPHWKGWKLIADDPNNDARCDSLTITSWLDRSGARTEIHSERVAALAQDSIAARMRKTICRIPCEWDSNAFDSRWSWLVGSTKGDGTQLTEADYKIFRQHIESLCFNYSPLFNAIYTLHPIQFILELRKCGWMKLEEAIQTIPQTTKKLTSFSFIKHENGSNELMTTRLRRWLPALNKMLRKYGMDLPQRRVHFLANVWEETDHL
jgi:hydroxyethylthiazole kinase